MAAEVAMTRIRNATNRPLVRFRRPHATGMRYLLADCSAWAIDPNGRDSATGGDLTAPGEWKPEVYPEDGLEVVSVGMELGDPLPLRPDEVAMAFKLVQMNGAPSCFEWGILDEWDTVYEIREATP